MGLDNSVCKDCIYRDSVHLVVSGVFVADVYNCMIGHYICGPGVEDCNDYTKRVTNTLYYD